MACFPYKMFYGYSSKNDCNPLVDTLINITDTLINITDTLINITDDFENGSLKSEDSTEREVYFSVGPHLRGGLLLQS